MSYKLIDLYINFAKEKTDKYIIVLIANVNERSLVSIDFSEHSVIGDYYTIKQFQEISEAIIANGFELICYYNENDFIKDYLNGIIQNTEKEILIINTAKTGTSVGRKSLIPAFCELNNIKYLGCDPYTISFAKDKFHWHLLLDKFNIPISRFWSFQKGNGWIKNDHPDEKEKIIAKLNSESCGIGLSSDNVCYYTKQFDDFLFNLATQYNQNILVEKFIEGYEVEVPLIIAEKALALEPIAVTIDGKYYIGDKILDYDTRAKDKYIYIPFKQIKKELSSCLQICAEKAAKAIGLTGICRVDFRIDKTQNFFVTDIATTPFIDPKSSIGLCFYESKYSYEDFFALMIALILKKYELK